MSTIESGIKRHSVLIYFALVFVIAWGGGFLLLGGDGFPPSGNEFENLGALVYVVLLCAPTAAGILMIGLVDGRPGVKDLFTRLRRWRAGVHWYAFALLPGLVMAVTTLLLSLVSPDFRPAIFDSHDKSGVVMLALLPAIMAGIFEEIGWTGFAVPHLRARHSILATGLAVGVVWGAWHFPLFWESNSFSATLPLAILLTRLFSWLPPFRVLMVWLHDRTQSIPAVMLMHAVVTFVSLTLFPEMLTGVRLLISLLANAATMWLLLAAVGMANRWQLAPSPAFGALRAELRRAQ